MTTFLEVLTGMLAPLLLVGLGVFVLVRFMTGRNAAHLNQVGQQIAGAGNYVVEDSAAKVFGYSFWKVLRIKRPAGDVMFVDHEGSKSAPAYTLLFLRLPIVSSFEVSREGVLNRLGKQLTLARDIELGRKDLDDAFFLSVEDDVHGRQLLAQPKMTEALVRLLDFDSFERLLGATRKRTESRHIELVALEFREGLSLRFRGLLRQEPRHRLAQAFEILDAVAEAVRKTGSAPKDRAGPTAASAG